MGYLVVLILPTKDPTPFNTPRSPRCQQPHDPQQLGRYPWQSCVECTKPGPRLPEYRHSEGVITLIGAGRCERPGAVRAPTRWPVPARAVKGRSVVRAGRPQLSEGLPGRPRTRARGGRFTGLADRRPGTEPGRGSRREPTFTQPAPTLYPALGCGEFAESAAANPTLGVELYTFAFAACPVQ